MYIDYRFVNEEKLRRLLAQIRWKWEGIRAGYFNGYKMYIQQFRGVVTIYSESHSGWFETLYKEKE